MGLGELGICGYCGRQVANGIGGEGSVINPILHALPSSHLFKKSAIIHDILYHHGYTETDRKIADNVFLERMLEAVSRLPFLHRQWYKIQAYRNYYAVRWCGKKFFNYEGCPKLKRK